MVQSIELANLLDGLVMANYERTGINKRENERLLSLVSMAGHLRARIAAGDQPNDRCK